MDSIILEKNNIEKEKSKHEAELAGITAEDKYILPKLEKLARIIEELKYKDEQYKHLISLGESTQYAKECMEDVYKRMREEVSPVFLEKLSEIVEKVTKMKYKNIKITDKSELLVESELGDYISINNLSIGTIYQIYFALRISFLNEITNEKIPIILDEPFVYYDENRLLAVLEFLKNEYNTHQIIMFSCSNREICALDKLKIAYNRINLY